MANPFTELGRVFATIVAVLTAAPFCTPKGSPPRGVVLEQVSRAIETRTVPRAGSGVEEYFACDEYVRPTGFEYIGGHAVGADSAEVIVQIQYEYKVSSTRIKDDLRSGIRALRYYKYSCEHLQLLDNFKAQYWDAGTKLVVPGQFLFVRTSGKWVLQ